MKLRELQKLDQNIIKMLADHKGIDRAIRGEVLAQSLNIDLRTLQSRISSLQKKRCAIGKIMPVLASNCCIKSYLTARAL